jgi:hypothetical protein
MVKAAPNKSVVLAKVIGVEKFKQPDIYTAKLQILDSHSVAGYENFLDNSIGKFIDARIYSKKRLVPSEKPERISLRYEGDESGGIYYGSMEEERK